MSKTDKLFILSLFTLVLAVIKNDGSVKDVIMLVGLAIVTVHFAWVEKK